MTFLACNPNATSVMTRIVDAYNNKDTDENKSRLKGIMGGNFTNHMII